MSVPPYHYCLFLLLFCLQPAVLHAGSPQTGFLTTSVEASTVPEKKRVQSGLYLSPSDAQQAMQTRNNVVFIDVRDPREFQFVGFPKKISANIPFLMTDDALAYDGGRDQYKMVPNENFISEVERFLSESDLDKSVNIIVQCRSGGRSAKAANALTANGYQHVWQQVEGMEGDKDKSTGHRTVNGWKNAGLPWTYALTPEIAYRRAELNNHKD